MRQAWTQRFAEGLYRGHGPRNKTRLNLALLLAALACGCLRTVCPAQRPGEVHAYTNPEHDAATRLAEAQSVLHPFWADRRMESEPVLFVSAASGSPATGYLLFPAEKVVRVTDGDGSVTYAEGRDYTWQPGTRRLTLTPHSRIPFLMQTELYPPKGAGNAYGETVDGKAGLLFDFSGRKFQSLQVKVTYDHTAVWEGFRPRSAARLLPRTMSRLRHRKPLKIAVLGDSISVGYCASDFFHGPPFQPPYVGLVQEGLTVEYRGSVNMVNFSVGGKLSGWGVTQAPAVAAEHPDLVVLAFGMNDASQAIPAEQYAEHIRDTIEIIRKVNPNAEFILVATMTGNPQWSRAHQESYTGYEQALRGMTGPGIALADMTAMWRDLLNVKPFSDLTGNGINHPNDFGYRVYAQVLLGLFKQSPPERSGL